MAVIQFTKPGAARRWGGSIRVLTKAAVAAARAPSIFNSQPWRWRIADDTAELRADRGRQLRVVDPDGRLLTISCGAALHHARTALDGDGYAADVVRLPDEDDPDLLARIRIVGTAVPAPAAVRLQLAMALRHTDRRPFADLDVPPAVLDRLRDVAERQGAHLHLLHPGQVVTSTQDLVDRHARYAILFSDTDTPADWLTAGEALSAVLLTATAERLAASPISDVVEVPATRLMLRAMLGGFGYPMVALRIGVPDRGAVPATGRREADDVVDVIAPAAG
jgi:hypothetical protein